MAKKEKQTKKVKVLNQDYYNKRAIQDENQREHLALTRRYRFKMLILCGVVLVITLTLGFNIIQNNIRASILNKKTDQAKIELKEAKQKNKDLKLKVEQLKDSDYVAKIIRQKYYFSKDGETIYSLPSDKSKTVTDN